MIAVASTFSQLFSELLTYFGEVLTEKEETILL